MGGQFSCKTTRRSFARPNHQGTCQPKAVALTSESQEKGGELMGREWVGRSWNKYLNAYVITRVFPGYCASTLAQLCP